MWNVEGFDQLVQTNNKQTYKDFEETYSNWSKHSFLKIQICLFRNWLMDPVSEINLRQSGMVDNTRHVIELSLVIEFVIVTAGLVIYLA